MSALRDIVQSNPSAWLAWGGLLIGIVFGYVVFRTNFCTMGSISDLVTFGDYRRFRAWVLASATALVGTQALALAGWAPLDKAMYLSANFNLVGNVLGGLMFGFGMVFAGGCASRNLARVGGGDLRSLLTLIVMGLFAYMAIGGILGPIRNALEQVATIDLRAFKISSQGVGDVLGTLSGVGSRTGTIVATAAVAIAALVYCFSEESFRSSPVHVVSGLIVGLCVVAGWTLTGIAFDEMADKPTNPISLTYVRPTADTIEWLQRFTAGMVPGFGVTTVLGAILGAFIAAKSMGRFRWTTFSNIGDTKRSLFGAALMGIGGVLALGCTVGQAITGVSTLALGSFLTFAGIVYGGIHGMRRLEKVLMDEV